MRISMAGILCIKSKGNIASAREVILNASKGKGTVVVISSIRKLILTDCQRDYGLVVKS